MFHFLLKCFISYLNDHYQLIKIGSALSVLCKLLFDVPHGSVLGHLLFSLYNNSLSFVTGKYKGVKFHFYADVTHIFYVHLSQKNTSSAFELLNRYLDDVKEWLSTSKLKLNPDKTEFIVFDSKRQRDKFKACFPIDICDSPLCPAESVKNLGMWFDYDFSYPNIFRLSAKDTTASFCHPLPHPYPYVYSIFTTSCCGR